MGEKPPILDYAEPFEQPGVLMVFAPTGEKPPILNYQPFTQPGVLMVIARIAFSMFSILAIIPALWLLGVAFRLLVSRELFFGVVSVVYGIVLIYLSILCLQAAINGSKPRAQNNTPRGRKILQTIWSALF